MQQRSSLLFLLATLVLSSGAIGDTVLLTNGNRFDDVVARAEGDTIRIRLSYGEIGLPTTMVRRVEKAPSMLESYLERSAALEVDANAGARRWLELAFDARSAGLHDGYRRALLRAAAIQPDLPELAASMRELDYVLDPASHRWTPYVASLQRREETRAVGRRVEPEVDRGSASAPGRDRLLDVLETMALAELAEELGATRRSAPIVPVLTVPVLGAWGWGVSVGAGGDAESRRATFEALTRRQPGSLLPVAVPRHRASAFRPPAARPRPRL